MVLEAIKALSAEEITELCLRHTLYDWTAQAGLTPLPVVSAKGVHFDTADGRRFIDFLQEENALSPYDNLANQKWADEVRRLLDTLTPIESRIIRWRFGLDDEDELTLKEIGDKYNLSRERIRQLQEQALGKIRKQMRDF